MYHQISGDLPQPGRLLSISGRSGPHSLIFLSARPGVPTTPEYFPVVVTFTKTPLAGTSADGVVTGCGVVAGTMVVLTGTGVSGGAVVAGTVISGVGVIPGVPAGFCVKTKTPAITIKTTSARPAISFNGNFPGEGVGGGCDTMSGGATGTAVEASVPGVADGVRTRPFHFSRLFPRIRSHAVRSGRGDLVRRFSQVCRLSQMDLFCRDNRGCRCPRHGIFNQGLDRVDNLFDRAFFLVRYCREYG